MARERKFPLSIHVCEQCGLIQILGHVDPEILFQDYSFSSSTIKALVDHFGAYASWLVDRFHPKTVVEFGCNDGALLTPLSVAQVNAIGVDLSKNITEMARAKGLKVFTGYFNSEVATRIRDEYGPVDVVTGSNAFAHNDRPELILEASAHVLADSGHLCLEFMYAGDLLEQLQWDTLYHEHLPFYSLSTVAGLLSCYGFRVIDGERLPMRGGSLRVTAARRPGPLSANAEAVIAYESRTALNCAETWHDFGGQSIRKIEIVAEVFESLSRKRTIWGYGAPGKATSG
jgi:SAM-dependent methyltransferase